jgi:HK97 gp10 family phage protein
VSATLKSRLPAIAAELRPRVSAAVKEGAEAIAQTAQERAPVATGELRDSIEARRHGPAEYGVYATWYWLFPEFGTQNAPAQPYMLPATEFQKEPIVAGVQAILKTL